VAASVAASVAADGSVDPGREQETRNSKAASVARRRTRINFLLIMTS
jgi:hypothetical protein